VDPDADPDNKAASTPGLTALRKSLLPENALSARFTTTAGPDLKQVSGTVYVGSHEGTADEQRVLWAKVGEKMYPTGQCRHPWSPCHSDSIQYTRSGITPELCPSSTPPRLSWRSSRVAQTS